MKFILIIITLLLSINIHAAQIATITSPKAVVFADMRLTTPIGYISYGKKVKVGEIERKDGTILPIAISGRIAYIQVKDISLKKTQNDPGINTPKVTEHDIEITFKTDQDKLSENNYVTFGVGSFSGGEDWESYSEGFEDTPSNLTNITINMEHRSPLQRLSWGFGIGYYTVGQEELQAKTLTLEGTLYYALVNFRYISLELFGGANFSGDFKVSQGGTEQISKGVLYGYNIGGIARLLPYSKIGFYIGASIKNFYIKDLDPIENKNGDDVILDGLSGYNLFAGLSYKF